MFTKANHVYNDRRIEHKMDDTDNSVIFERQAPYGMWQIRFAKGQTPAVLQGNWTQYEIAYRAARSYLEGRKNAPTGVSRDPSPASGPEVQVIRSSDEKPKKK